jgi:hypothetical protein
VHTSMAKLLASLLLLGLAVGCPAPEKERASVAVQLNSAPQTSAGPTSAEPRPGFRCLGERHEVAGGAICAYRMEARWPLAQVTCALGGGRLMSITDRPTSESLFAAMGTPGRTGHHNIWIGATDVVDEGVWRWVDGKRVGKGQVRWAHRQPDNASKKEHCAEWRAGDQTWNDLPCEVDRYYLCEPRPDSELVCLGQSISVGDRRFCFYSKGVKWPKAADACESTGGRLAMIDTDAVSAGVRAHFDAANWWIGINDREKEGRWRWDDLELAEYGEWARDQPDDANRTEDCAVWRSTDGRWFDTHCRAYNPFICQEI